MSNLLDCTHYCYEWIDADGDYREVVLHQLDNLQCEPELKQAMTQTRVHITPVWYNYATEEWYLSSGEILDLPYKVR
jgi:hypothetical protein